MSRPHEGCGCKFKMNKAARRKLEKISGADLVKIGEQMQHAIEKDILNNPKSETMKLMKKMEKM